jgi:hypothetical protein
MLYQDMPNYYSILSGKVTTCVDVGERVSGLIAASQA